jgi:hypothetical protein
VEREAHVIGHGSNLAGDRVGLGGVVCHAALDAREVERCCDEEAVGALGCDPAHYARSLLEVLELKRALQPVPAFPGVRPVDITSQRLERIMQLRQGCRLRTPWWCWATLVLCAFATLPGAARVTAEDKNRAAETGSLPGEGAEHYVYVHNVADLAGIAVAGASDRGEGGSADQAVRSADLEELARRIRAKVQPRTWDGAGGTGSLQPYEATLSLIVSQTAKTQLAVHKYLNELRTQRGLPVNPVSPHSSGTPRDESALQAKIYAVADLVVPVPNFGGSTAPEQVKPDFGALTDLINSTVEPTTWSCAGGSGTITAVPANLSLLIEQTASVHRQIAELLAQLRRLQDVQVSVETRVLGVPERLFELIGKDFPGADGAVDDGRAFDRRGWIHISADVAAKLSNACQGDPRAEIYQSPKITLFNAQGACIGVEDHGTEFNLKYQVVVTADGKSVHLTVATGQAKAESRLPTHSARIPDGDALLLDATEELKARAEVQTCSEQVGPVSLISYVSHLFAEPPPRREIDHILLLVSPRVVIVKEEESPP